jgi:hypothetical protein
MEWYGALSITITLFWQIGQELSVNPEFKISSIHLAMVISCSFTSLEN